MTAVFVDPFVQLQAASVAAARLAEARSAGAVALNHLDDADDALLGLTRLIDAAIVTVKGMTE